MTPSNLKAIVDSSRTQTVRYLLLMTLNVARPGECQAYMLRSVLTTVYPDATEHEVMRELDYLHSRQLITVRSTPLNQTFAKIVRHGIDVLERTIECDPGILLPPLG